jgi:beta-N-acetylhexosaminidase
MDFSSFLRITFISVLTVVVCGIAVYFFYPRAEVNEFKPANIKYELPKASEVEFDKTELTDKIGQMLIVVVPHCIAKAKDICEANAEIAKDLARNYNIGGFSFQSNNSIYSVPEAAPIRSAAKIAPFFATDEEGGEIVRTANKKLKQYSAKYLGTLTDKEVENIGFEIGQELLSYGYNMNFAPVVDVDDGKNAGISKYKRAFSSDPDIIAQKAEAYASGLRRANIVPVYKHFPGLGRATSEEGGNPDFDLTTSPPLQALKEFDLLPYKKILNTQEMTAVMMSNQIVPDLTGGSPSTLSRAAYDLLRKEFGFDQLIITDELLGTSAKKALPHPEDVVAAAIKAGADVAIVDCKEDVINKIIKAVVEKVKNGEIKESQINASYKRIMKVKRELNLVK